MLLRLFGFDLAPRYALPRCPWIFAVLIVLGLPRNAPAHEGHAALPTKGAAVVGDQLLLSEGARKAIGLETAKVTLTDMRRIVWANARVETPWRQQTMVTTLVPGRIERVLVRPGQRVTAGQELARVESLKLESLQLSMLQADAELTLAKDKVRRKRLLAEQGIIAEKVVIDAEATLRQKNAELEIAMCKLRALGLAQSDLDKMKSSRKPLAVMSIISPIDGTVAEADVRVGQVVKTTEHLFHIVDPSIAWVIGDVLESDISPIRLGQPVTIRFESIPNRTFSGAVDHMHLKMDPEKRTRAVVVILDNTAGLLRRGMFGQMSIEVVRSTEAVVCPVDGLIENGGQTYVLLRRGAGKYLRRPVSVGIRDSARVEITNGLFPGDQVVVTGNHVLFSLFGADQNKPEKLTRPGKVSVAHKSQLRKSLTQRRNSRGKPLVVRATVELPTDRKVFASSRIEGRISRILVEHSQPVRAGEVLAEVDSLELRNLQGDLLDTHSRLIWTDQRKTRLESLAQQNLTSKKELWQLRTDYQVLSSRVSSLTRHLSMIGVPTGEIERILRTDLSDSDCDLTLLRSVPIVAPTDGVVADFDIFLGQIVQAQTPLFEIHNPSTMWIKGYVFQTDAMGVQKGQAARVTFPAYRDLTITGTVVRMAPELASSERVLPVWIEVDNSDGRLIEGLLARIEIDTASDSLALVPAPENK